jgi:hypothetical protein
MLKKFDVIHIFLILILIFLLVLYGQVNSKKNHYKDLYSDLSVTTEKQSEQIDKLEVVTEEIDLESIDHEVYELSTSFIKAINEGTHDDFFSEELYDSMFSGEVEQDYHEHSSVDTNIMNITVLRESNEEYLVYGIYSNEFGTLHDVTNENAPKMIDYYSISITWIKQEDEFVVSDYQVNFLKDNISDMLNELEKKNEGVQNE